MRSEKKHESDRSCGHLHSSFTLLFSIFATTALCVSLFFISLVCIVFALVDYCFAHLPFAFKDCPFPAFFVFILDFGPWHQLINKVQLFLFTLPDLCLSPPFLFWHQFCIWYVSFEALNVASDMHTCIVHTSLKHSKWAHQVANVWVSNVWTCAL